MCGIGGAIGRPQDPVAARFGIGCLDANARRGPDHRATQEYPLGDWTVSLAHNRLTILDLSPLGNQPMEGRPGSTWITFNGEIYNHDALRHELAAKGHGFRSTSDTEVLLAAYDEWGDSCLDRLNGMFAFGLLDAPRRRLLLVRDRFGVKPLHFHLSPERLLFSSTPLAIARIVGRAPDPMYLARGARFGLFDDDSGRSQYSQVRSVAPGHSVVVSLEGDALVSEARPFYRLHERVVALRDPLSGLDRAAAVTECRNRLGDAIGLRLRADVPVAISLSGGIDSGTIAALAAERHPGLVGYTFGHPDRPETEGPMARQIAQRTGMQVEFVWPGTRDMLRYFWECLEVQDAPFTTGSIVAQYAVYQAVRAAGVKVLLGGQGGDEVFMGYRKYLAWRWLDAVRRRAPAVALSSGADLARALWAERSRWGTYLRAARRHRGAGANDSLVRVEQAPDAPYRADPALGLSGRQVADITTGGLPTLLRYEDRNSAESSVESRLPFLDYRLAEWAVAAPVDTKLVSGYGKWMLRQVARERLPRELIEGRGKRGFDVDIREWLAAGLGAVIRSEIAERWHLTSEFFVPGTRPDEAFADGMLGGQPRRFADAVTALWVGRCLA